MSSSDPSAQSSSPSHAQFCGIQRPFSHLNWPSEHVGGSDGRTNKQWQKCNGYRPIKVIFAFFKLTRGKFLQIHHLLDWRFGCMFYKYFTHMMTASTLPGGNHAEHGRNPWTELFIMENIMKTLLINFFSCCLLHCPIHDHSYKIKFSFLMKVFWISKTQPPPTPQSLPFFPLLVYVLTLKNCLFE